jgi:hypothetical protein
MTTLQLALVAPRTCAGPGCDCRLSVADVGGLCVNCAFALEQAAKAKAERRGVNGQRLPSQYVTRRAKTAAPRRRGKALRVTADGVKLCACGKAPVMKKRLSCYDCHAAYNRAYRRGEPPPKRGAYPYQCKSRARSA